MTSLDVMLPEEVVDAAIITMFKRQLAGYIDRKGLVRCRLNAGKVGFPQVGTFVSMNELDLTVCLCCH